ncbi:MAG: proton-conducting transporter transmembrane domain-containing protein [Pirellulaceae bacterium]
MLSVWLVLGASGVLGVSGLPACLLSFRSSMGQRVTVLLVVAGSLAGLAGLGVATLEATPPTWRVPWLLPWGEFAVTLDALSVMFLAPVFVVPALGAIYGLAYWRQLEHPDSGRRLGLFYGLLAGSMALVVISRDGVLFLIAWEAMAIAAYFAATADERNPAAQHAGWVYLIATHAGTLCLIAMFALWHQLTGSFAMTPVSVLSAAMSGTLFVLALIGFGFKAGLMPLHVWLPGAHANAPSHVSAVMSGVMLKMGVYGIVRMTSMLPTPAPWWGGVLLAVGAFTGLAGIAFAVGQHDIKRLLAYSSVENIGIIAMGLGLALLGRSQGRNDWIVLGLGSALLHVWNHALFKSLLFLLAGAIIHAVDTREIDRLGGLAKRMPWSSALFVVGAVAICALPPLNGFVSEWLLYLGLFRTLSPGGTAALAAAAMATVGLATIGAMAVACFVKLFGTVFLGTPRSDAAKHAHDPPAHMLLPMAALALGCMGLGVLPVFTAPLLGKAVQSWAALPDALSPLLTDLAPLNSLSCVALGICGLVLVIAMIWTVLSRWKIIQQAGTWDCGYAQPTARMQYTGSSFAQMLVNLFAFIVWPRRHEPKVVGVLPRKTRFKSVMPDTVLDRLVRPVFRLAGQYLPRLRVFQQGQTQFYVLYVLVTVIVLLLWGSMGAQP